MVDELPSEFSDLLGQLVYLASRTDNLLGALTPSTDKLPEGNRGLSGTELLKALRPLMTPGSKLESILAAYPDMYAFRNRLIHGSMNFSGNVLSVWYVPTKGKGNAALSMMLTLEQLQGFVQSWVNLRDAAHEVTHELS
jgi:hypothetical protein